jgi:5'-nucleotidase / UDP-sugar diphosphatase
MQIRLGHVAATVVLALALAGCSDDTVPRPDGLKLVDRAPGADKGADRGPSVDKLKPDAGIPQELIILHTNDLHSAVEGFSPVSEYTPDATGNDGTRGGFARLATVIKNERTAAGATPVLLLDAGDWSQGSLFGWLLTTKSVELSLMQQMGYDAITFGNHEFEYTSAALAGGISAAMKGGFNRPILSPVNMKLDTTDSGNVALAQLQQAGALVKKLVKTVGVIKVGIFGLMGKNAAADVKQYSADPVSFDDPVAAAQAMVKELRETDKVNLVICVSHGGSHWDATGEDVDLAKKVPGIDVIVSGHSHDALTPPLTIVHADGKTATFVAQSGYWGRNLGKIPLKVQGGVVTVTGGKLIPVDDSVKGDTAITAAVSGYKADINAMLAASGSPLKYEAPIAKTGFDLTFLAKPALETTGDLMGFEEGSFGDLIADAYLTITKAVQPTEPPDVAVEANGYIGIPALKGSNGVLWFADLYHAVHSGIGPDQHPGFPLVTYFLSGAELKAGMELLGASQAILGSKDFFLQLAGMKVEYLAAGAPFNSVLSIKVGGVDVSLNDTSKCYKVVSNLALGLAMAELKAATGGLISVTPKENDCKTPVASMLNRIVDRDPLTAGMQELKNWQAVVTYMSKFVDGNVPEIYKTPQGRIVAK